MKEFKRYFLQDILKRILKAYRQDGYTVDNYTDKIILPELTNEELTWLKETIDGKF